MSGSQPYNSPRLFLLLFRLELLAISGLLHGGGIRGGGRDQRHGCAVAVCDCVRGRRRDHPGNSLPAFLSAVFLSAAANQRDHGHAAEFGRHGLVDARTDRRGSHLARGAASGLGRIGIAGNRQHRRDPCRNGLEETRRHRGRLSRADRGNTPGAATPPRWRRKSKTFRLRMPLATSGNRFGGVRRFFQRARRDAEIHLTGAEKYKCPYCLQPIEARDPRGMVVCPICHTRHHKDCWDVTGMCQVPHYHA